MKRLVMPRLLLALATAVMLAAVIAGLYALGSPAHQRQLRLDQKRVSDLSTLSIAIRAYWTEHKALPSGLDVLDSVRRFSTDPVNGSTYSYAITGSSSYSLCATFAVASEFDRSPAGSYYMPPQTAIRWDHPGGKHCFELSADPVRR